MTTQQVFRNTLVVILTFVAAYALFLSARIIIVLLVAIIIASAVRPLVLWLSRRIPYGLSILVVYGLLILLIAGLLIAVLPPAANRLAVYIENDDRLATRLISAQRWLETNIEQRFDTNIQLLDEDGIRQTVNNLVTQLRESIPALAGEFGGLVGDFVLVLVMGAYWLTSRDSAVESLTSLFSIGRRARIRDIFKEIEGTLGSYVRGVMLVVSFVGVANFILLTLFGVPNAVTLGFIVGITTALPIIGGYIGAASAALLALLSSPLHAIFAIISFVLVQQVENHYLTPRVMANSVNLNPILVILVLFIGFSVGGVIGGLLSVPVAGTFMILIRHLIIEPKREEVAAQVPVKGGILLSPGDVGHVNANAET
ncbi:MAG: AI-2E family transporter [Anaerolinea sp.]|nr:AI-2E family transporter [Anaerolinea sp.]